MYISYSSSDFYAPHTGISIASLLENNKDVENIEIFILDLGIEEDNKRRLSTIVDKFNRKLSFISVIDKDIVEYVGKDVPPHIGSYATYARLCAPIVYPTYVDRIVCVDSDMIITGSIRIVANMDMTGKVVAAVPCLYKRYHSIAGKSAEEKGIMANHKYYINNGFMIINLENWRKYDFENRVKEAVKDMSVFKHKDQSIMNYILEDNFLLPIPLRYNFYLHSVPKYKLKSLNVEPFTRHDLKEAEDNPVVIHYVGDETRPWFRENISTMSEYYFKYKAMTPYADYPIVSLFETPSYKRKGYLEKCFLRVYLKTYHSPIGAPIMFLKKTLSRIIK